MLVKTFGSAICGINAMTVTVEVNIDKGIGYMVVGLPDNAVRESQQRIESAIGQYGYRIPGKKVVVNLAPAETQQQIRAHGVEHRQKRLQEIADGHITSLLSCKIPQPKFFA